MASHYRIVKRLEQVMLYLLESSSCPHLRSLDLARGPPLQGNFKSQNIDGSLSKDYQIQFALVAPFLKAFEFDNIPKIVTATTNMQRNQIASAAEEAEGKYFNSKNTSYLSNNAFELEKTSRIVEVAGKFWSIIPEHWRKVYTHNILHHHYYT